ncbi:MAG: thermonuclease family protein [Halobacteriales archaeon]
MCRRAVILAVLLVLSGCATTGGGAGGTPTEGRTVTITEVVDGDTMEARYPNGTAVTLRLLGVDTPETHAENEPSEFEGVPGTDAGAACLRAVGQEATEYVAARIAGERVRIRFDAAAGRRGGYGRLLVYLDHNGTTLNHRLVEAGYGRAYTAGEFAAEERYRRAEAEARGANRGVWRCRSPGTRNAPGERRSPAADHPRRPSQKSTPALAARQARKPAKASP